MLALNGAEDAGAEEDGADDGDDRGDPLGEERAVEGEEEARGADDQEERDIEDARLSENEISQIESMEEKNA